MIDASVQARLLVLDALKQTGTTQTEVARRMGLSARHVNHVLHGHRGMTLEVLEGMLLVLGYRLALKKVKRRVRKNEL